MNAPAPCPQPLSAAHGPDALVLAGLSMRGGRPEPTRSNLLDIFRGDARVCGRLRYNDVTRNLELDDLQGQDCLFELHLFIERTYRITPGSKAQVEAAEKAAKEHRSHPIQAWLDGLVWV